jgi:hypothetical protein
MIPFNQQDKFMKIENASDDNFQRVAKKIRKSWLFKYILIFLSEKEIVRL